jgi:hypothetical protein
MHFWPLEDLSSIQFATGVKKKHGNGLLILVTPGEQLKTSSMGGLPSNTILKKAKNILKFQDRAVGTIPICLKSETVA